MFTISTRDIRSISTYSEALARYESITPIRGRSDDCRPLGSRRAQHMRIAKVGVEVHCILYHTACVIFKPCGDIVVNGGWVSQSTANFIDAVLWRLGRCFMRGGRLWFRVAVDGHRRIYSADTLVLDGLTGLVRLSNTIKKEVADREARKALRNEFRELGLYDYIKVMIAAEPDVERNPTAPTLSEIRSGLVGFWAELVDYLIWESRRTVWNSTLFQCEVWRGDYSEVIAKFHSRYVNQKKWIPLGHYVEDYSILDRCR